MKPKNLLCIIIMLMAFGIATAGVVYDYDNGNVTGAPYPGTDLNGQDGWVQLSNASYARDDLAGRVGFDGLVGSSGGDSQMCRVNNAAWDYGIIGDHIIIEQTGRFGSGQSLTFALGSDVDDDGELNGNEVAFFFGHHGAGGWYIRRSAWGSEVKSNISAGATGMWRIVIDVDLAANGGDGSGSLYVQKIGDDAGNAVEDTLTAVAACQNIDLDIASRMNAGATDPATWNGIFTRNSNASVDNLTIRGDIAAPHAFGAAPNPWEGGELLDPANAVLSWKTGRVAGDWTTVNSAITAHKVYIGTPSDPNLLLATTIDVTGTGGADWDPSGQWELEKDSTYLWRVDEVTATGIIKGVEWSFYTEKTPPQIITHPADSYTPEGEDAVITVDAIDPLGAGLTYEWRNGAEEIVGGNSATLTISNAQISDEDTFYCSITNTSGTTVSKVASLTIARLIGNWLVDGSLTDSSGYGNDADPNGNPVIVDGPLEGTSALQFNGSDQWATVTIDETLNKYDKQYTIAFWVRDEGASTWRRFINYGYYNINGGSFARADICRNNWGTRTLAFRMGNKTGGTFETAVMPQDEWNHFAAIYDGTGMYLYKNGSLVSSPTNASGPMRSVLGEPIVLGARIYVANDVPTPASSHFKGSLSDVRVYNYAMDDLGVVTMYTTITGESVCFDRPEFDISGPDGDPDCVVNLFDFAALASDWMVSNQVDPGN
ncbi:MAG: hypothetical protein KAS23_16860 [Anaerohalosphaera sp.]|nr:hypothetical protein [Anaerohalosphaera sp.]